MCYEQCLFPENKIFALLKTQRRQGESSLLSVAGCLFIATGRLVQHILFTKHRAFLRLRRSFTFFYLSRSTFYFYALNGRHIAFSSQKVLRATRSFCCKGHWENALRYCLLPGHTESALTSLFLKLLKMTCLSVVADFVAHADLLSAGIVGLLSAYRQLELHRISQVSAKVQQTLLAYQPERTSLVWKLFFEQDSFILVTRQSLYTKIFQSIT